MKRFGQMIQLKPEFKTEYLQLHKNPWPEVNQVIKACNITNYTIFLKDNLLFAYFEYTGDDFDADMKKMGESEVTKRWWKKTDPCQIPIDTARLGEWWSTMEEIYHLE